MKISDNEKERKSDKFFFLSLAFLVVALIMLGVSYYLFYTATDVNFILIKFLVFAIAALFHGGVGCMVASLLANPQNTKAKVLMGVYIAIYVVIAVAIIYGIVMLILEIKQCIYDCEHMGPLP